MLVASLSLSLIGTQPCLDYVCDDARIFARQVLRHFQVGAVTLRPALLLDFFFLLLGGGFLYYALKLKFAPQQDLPMTTFRYSISYLMALFSFLLIDHYLPAVWPG